MVYPSYSLYEKLVLHHRGRSIFTILIFFLLAFVLSRFAVYVYQFGKLPEYPLNNVFGTHIHHFVFGIALVSLVGFLSLSLPSHIFKAWRLRLAAVYGFGLGWIMDEFGMWLHLEDNYFLRLNYDAIIITAIILVNFVYFSKIWKHIFYKIFKNFR
jgi:hypothetical protein